MLGLQIQQPPLTYSSMGHRALAYLRWNRLASIFRQLRRTHRRHAVTLLLKEYKPFGLSPTRRLSIRRYIALQFGEPRVGVAVRWGAPVPARRQRASGTHLRPIRH